MDDGSQPTHLQDANSVGLSGCKFLQRCKETTLSPAAQARASLLLSSLGGRK